MGLGYLIAGLLFFFLPNFTIIDIFPDFIGCILIIIGLGRLADLSPGLEDAKKQFLKVLYIHIAKFVLMFTVPFFGNSKDGGYILIFSFCFAVFDLIFTLPAFKTLLNGFVYLGNRTNTSAIFNNQSEFSTLTSIFIVVKALLAMIPDLSYVSNPEYSGTVSLEKGFYISDYKTLLVGINFLVTGIIGVIWICWAVKYFNGIRKDTKLMSFLENKYITEILPNKGLFIRRGMKLGFVFITLGSILMFDLLVDSVNVIPDFLGAVFFLLAAFVMRKYCNTKALALSSAMFFVFSAPAWAVQCKFAVDYPEVNILTNMDAYSFYIYVSIAAAAKYIVFGVFAFVLFKYLNSVIELHTGSPIDELEKIALSRKQQQIVLKQNNLLVLVLTVICCFTGIVRTVLLYSYPFLSVIDVIFNIIYVVYLSKLLTSMYDAIEYRYL